MVVRSVNGRRSDKDFGAGVEGTSCGAEHEVLMKSSKELVAASREQELKFRKHGHLHREPLRGQVSSPSRFPVDGKEGRGPSHLPLASQ